MDTYGRRAYAIRSSTVPILLDFILKMVLQYFIQHRIMNRADLDKSQREDSSLLLIDRGALAC